MARVLRHPDQTPTTFHGIVTVAPSMLEFFELMKKVCRTNASVLIRGETGTGKELVASALHNMSPRSSQSFRAINCATLTPELLASELFGHVRGAFTGAVRDRKGLFSVADKGTVFLDEIAELPFDIQARLLRVLQENTFVPVGGTEPIQVDVRLLSATHQALRAAVAEKRFREDLMYRIRVVPIFLPRLAERDGDIEALTWHFIDKFNEDGFRHVEGFSSVAMEAMRAYPWPGNVRELRNNIEYAFAIGEGPIITIDELAPELRGEPPEGKSQVTDLKELERQRILKALADADGKKGKAAELLGISRSTLWRKLRELQLYPDQ